MYQTVNMSFDKLTIDDGWELGDSDGMELGLSDGYGVHSARMRFRK